jgi:hypothetical protein
MMRGRVMQSFSAKDSAHYPANSPHNRRVHPALTSFADEVSATVARLFAYVGVLALFGILGIHAWDRLQVNLAGAPGPQAGWSVADRSSPAFALSPDGPSDKSDKSDSYVILRHPSGGRKDILRWSGAGERPVAELEIYRPGTRLDPVATARADLAGRMIAPAAELEAAGVIESKFGSVALLRAAGDREGAGSCLGFLKQSDVPALQLSGWSCQGASLPARREAIGCMLNHLMLLTAGNEPKLAEYFARAGLNRQNCHSDAASADWVTSARDPRLRGPL